LPSVEPSPVPSPVPTPVPTPEPTPEQAREILYLLKLSRYVHERMESMHRQGRIHGPIRSARGHEGTQVGAAYALGPDDSLFGTTGDLGAQLAKGARLDRLMANVWGRTGGSTRGRDGDAGGGDWRGAHTFTLTSGVPDAYPEAAGAALAYRLHGGPRVAMGMCAGDATWSERWHLSVEASAAPRLPVVWVVDHGPAATTGRPDVAGRASGYGMPGVRVDGSDVLEVYAAAVEAVERARSGGGPTLIESLPAEADPVERFSDLLLSGGVLDEAGAAAIQARVEREFNRAYEFGQRSPLPDPTELARGVFAGDGYWTGEAASSWGGSA
jgi:TPP-dependent pyruvate/acetoin dehydrogenase alpha subunit